MKKILEQIDLALIPLISKRDSIERKILAYKEARKSLEAIQALLDDQQHPSSKWKDGAAQFIDKASGKFTVKEAFTRVFVDIKKSKMPGIDSHRKEYSWVRQEFQKQIKSGKLKKVGYGTYRAVK